MLSGRTPAMYGEIVIDTNCVLDLWVFHDPAVDALRAALTTGRLRWIATPPMREELARVLAYPRIATRLGRPGPTRDAVLAAFDEWVVPVDVPVPASVRCRDPDDQGFIDLAVARRALLLSKDARVTGLARRLAPLGVHVLRRWPVVSPAKADKPA
ncbi:putative toxin-antitoxin system toxin component, PIN family [Ottowia beijingensis]